MAGSSGDVDIPQFCYRLPGSGSPLSDIESQESELMISTVLSVKSRRQTGGGRNRVIQHDANVTRSETVTPKAESNGSINDMWDSGKDMELKSKSFSELQPSEEGGGGGKDHPDSGPGQGLMSSYIAKMRGLGHRRASSAPIKRASITSTELRQDEVFVSTEAELAMKENRKRKMVCGAVHTLWTSSNPAKVP